MDGLIQVYTGNGKGKTTAAFGLALRAFGRGLKVIVFQMMKAVDSSGEQLALNGISPMLQVIPLGSGEFILGRKPTRAEIDLARNGWARVEAAIRAGNSDLIIIDELSHAINYGLLQLATVISCLKQKPESLELVLTGRAMPEAILAIADLVTEMKMIKHPFNRGIGAREGIEY
jgi:cob(I)alamin adenosyltransferase